MYSVKMGSNFGYRTYPGICVGVKTEEDWQEFTHETDPNGDNIVRIVETRYEFYLPFLSCCWASITMESSDEEILDKAIKDLQDEDAD